MGLFAFHGSGHTDATQLPLTIILLRPERVSVIG
jgi:hypothetical protein